MIILLTALLLFGREHFSPMKSSILLINYSKIKSKALSHLLVEMMGICMQVKASFLINKNILNIVLSGLITGVIVRIDTNSLTATPVAKVGGPCDEQHQESRCGRVLGMTFTQTGKLLVCDAVFGLFLIDLDKRTEENRISNSKYDQYVEYTPLLTPDNVVNGTRNIVFNSLVLASDDETVYLTVSSTNFPLQDALWEVASSPSGRIIKFNIESKETEVLVSDIR